MCETTCCSPNIACVIKSGWWKDVIHAWWRYSWVKGVGGKITRGNKPLGTPDNIKINLRIGCVGYR
jgi:hypothetical protein